MNEQMIEMYLEYLRKQNLLNASEMGEIAIALYGYLEWEQGVLDGSIST